MFLKLNQWSHSRGGLHTTHGRVLYVNVMAIAGFYQVTNQTVSHYPEPGGSMTHQTKENPTIIDMAVSGSEDNLTYWVQEPPSKILILVKELTGK